MTSLEIQTGGATPPDDDKDRLEMIKNRLGVDQKAQRYFQVTKGRFVPPNRIKREWDPSAKDATRGVQGDRG